MAKRNRTMTQRVIDKRLKEGRGQGRGIDYKPWLTIQDVASRGLAYRVKGWTIPRIYHLLSTLEYQFFLLLDWALKVIDICENFPLPLEETMAIAKGIGVRHPIDPKSRHPIVMTTDFVITLENGLQTVDEAYTVKYANDLASQRVIEKFEIERRYWEARRQRWGIVTDHEIPKTFANNVKVIHDYREITDRIRMSKGEMGEVEKVMRLLVCSPGNTLRGAARACDLRLGYDPGTSLTVAYHLIAQRVWQVDMNVPIEPGKSLILLNGAGEKLL